MFRTCKRQNSLPKEWPIKESSPVILLFIDIRPLRYNVIGSSALRIYMTLGNLGLFQSKILDD